MNSARGFFPILVIFAAMGAIRAASAAEPFGNPFWTRLIGTNDFDIAYDVAVSGNNVVGITGRVNGNLAGTSSDFPDAFVGALDSNGSTKWFDQFDRPGVSGATDEGEAVTFDTAGNLIAAGVLGGFSESDSFLRKYDTHGNLIWSRQFDVRDSTAVTNVVIDNQGRILVAGGAGQSFGNFDAFVSAWSLDGERLWTATIGSSGGENCQDMAVDSSGNIYLVGRTDGAFGGPQSGAGDAFVAKLNSAGDQIWVRQFGSSGQEQPFGVGVDAEGSVYVGGVTTGALGPVAMGGFDAFTAKLDSNGALVWVRQFGTAEADWVEGLTVSSSGLVIATGHSSGSLFAPNLGWEDVLLAGFDKQGELVRQLQFGSSGRDTARNVTTSADGLTIYVTGNTTGSLFGQLNSGQSDAFVVALAVPEPGSGIATLFGLVIVFATGQRCWR